AVFCSSADWMDRNLYRRIEIMFPVLDGKLKQRLIRELKTNLDDNTQAWELRADGTYRRCQPQAGDAAVSAQTVLLRELSESS
ncbi:MAG: RNA degradosome polyphosphate kinase, partial [Rhodospirillaceae bacterium]|nr:RNA degradosome polyphosphate kinase [Rhodospirillaceae bacterium]